MLDESLSCSPPINQPKKTLRFELDEAHHVLVVGCPCVLCLGSVPAAKCSLPWRVVMYMEYLFETCGTPTPKVLGLEPLK